MKNKINRSMLAVMGLMTLKAQAVGLGELVVHSKLGEPLTAEIQIIQSNGEFLAADDMIVNIATESEHAKRSLDGYLARQNLQLQLTETLSDDVSLKLSSNQPINEPFLNFLIELKWNAGRIIKEFTILLDPPGFQAEKTSTTIAPIATTAIVTKTPTTTKQTYRFEPAKKAVSNTPYTNGQYGPVQSGETLSEIAMRVRPAGYGIALVDMIEAIYVSNQAAFINGDKNLLQRGVILSIPEVNTVLAGSETSIQSVETITNKAQNDIEPVEIHFASMSQSIDLNTSYTFSGLKLSTELDRSFLEVAQAMVIESAEPVSELNESQVITEIETEASEIESSVITEVEQEVVEYTSETPVINSEEIINETSTEVLDNDVELENNQIIVETEATEAVIESTVDPIEATNNAESETETKSSSSANPIYLVISVIGAILFLSMSALLIYFRRNKEEAVRPNINLNIDKANTIPPRVFVNEKSNDNADENIHIIKETAAENVNSETIDLMDMEQTISEKTGHIATVVMSPEEFAEVGVNINLKEDETNSSTDDEALIKDFLNTVEIPDNIDEEHTIEEHSDFSIVEKSNEHDIQTEHDETFIDISVPLNHNDNEVNTIINEILEGELEKAPENDSLIIESENDYIDVPETTTATDDLELKTITENIAEMKKDSELIDLDSDLGPSNEFEPLEFSDDVYEAPEVLDSPNIEDLVVNFQTSHPEKEFEKQVSVFMAYGDYVGAEDVIEKALKESPENNTYRLAQLSLYKATGKFGAALVLSEELNLIKHDLTEIEQKKLELLSDDLNPADDDSINFAS